MDKETIGGWTPAELQNFLLNVAQPPPPPPGINLNTLRTEAMRVRQSLDLGEETVLMKGGILFPPRSFLGAGNTSNVEPLFAETTGTGLWIASGGRIVAQSADLPDQNDQINLANQRIHGSVMHIPTRSPVDNLHVFVTEIPSAYNSNHTELAIGKVGGTADAPVVTIIEVKTGIGTSLTSSTGMKTYVLSKTQVLDPGLYTVMILSDRASMTGNIGVAGRTTLNQDQTGPYVGGFPRTLYQNGVTNGIPLANQTWTPTGWAQGRPWFGLSFN